jgi:hypothetical protein
MLDWIKYAQFAAIICWVCFDIYSIYTLYIKPEVKLLHGQVIQVVKNTGYHTASLKILVQTNEGPPSWIVGAFRPNIRWIMQRTPSNQQTIYFYTKKDVHLSTTPQLAYGINPLKPCSYAKLIYDLYYSTSSNKTIVIIFACVLTFVLLLKFSIMPAGGLFYIACYWLFRSVVEGCFI